MTKPLNTTSCLLNSSLQMLIFIYQKSCKIINLMSMVEKYNLCLTDAGMGFFCASSLQLKNHIGASAMSYSPVLITTDKHYRVLNVYQCTTSISFSLLTSVSMNRESRTLKIQLSSLSQEIQMTDELHIQISSGPEVFSNHLLLAY